MNVYSAARSLVYSRQPTAFEYISTTPCVQIRVLVCAWILFIWCEWVRLSLCISCWPHTNLIFSPCARSLSQTIRQPASVLRRPLLFTVHKFCQFAINFPAPPRHGTHTSSSTYTAYIREDKSGLCSVPPANRLRQHRQTIVIFN